MFKASLMMVFALGMLGAARFSVWPARSYREWWVALFATELGYVWALLALGLAAWAGGLAARGPAGAPKVLAGVACVAALAAAAGFARPTWTAWRMSADVDARLTAVFGAGETPWTWGRLLRWPTSAEAVAVESFEAEGRAVDFYRARDAHGLAGAGQGPAEPGRAPCVVLVHGGGWDGGDKTELAGLNRWLAARGVAVVAFDYRLAPEFPWPAQAEDLRVVINWIRLNAKRLGVDPERLTVLGRSAGGQIAAATAYGETLPGVRAVVALYACHDMEFVWSIRSEKDALNSARLMTQFLGGGPEGEDQAERYRSASGERLAHPSAPKTLLIHGTLDQLVWCRHSERLAAALERAGVPHVFVKLPWATHAGEANLHGPSGQLITEAVLRVAQGATALRE
jgi:acetyl esterase/lipase